MPHLKSNPTRWSFCIWVVLFFVGCGRPRVESPKNQPVSAVEFPQNRGFSLTAGNGDERQYFAGGSLLIWKEETRRDLVARLSRLSRAYNEAQVDVVSAHREASRDLQSLQLEMESLVERRAEALKFAKFADRQASLAASQNWFETELQEIASRFPDEFDTRHARKVFQRYCEARLWKMATSPLLAGLEYEVRPTANLLCESQYQARELFESDVCEQPLEGEKRNYFRCFWQALARTSFVTEGPLSEDEHGPQLIAIAHSSKMRDWFASPETRGEDPVCGLDKPLSHDLFTRFQVRGAEDCVIPGSQLPLSFAVRGQNKRLGEAPPEFLIRAIERFNAPKFDRSELYLISSFGEARHELSALESEVQGLTLQLGILADPRGNCSGGRQLSLNDLELNIPFADFGFVREECAGLPTRDEFPAIFVSGSELADLDQRIALAGEALAEKETAVCAESLEIRERYQRVSVERAELAEAETFLFPRFVLDFADVPAAQELRALTLMLHGRSTEIRILKGCFEKVSGRGVTCPSGVQEEHPPLAVRIDPISQEISVKASWADLNSKNPIETVLAKSDEPSQQAFQARVSGVREIAFALYPNAFGGLIPFLSGGVELISAEGTIVARGLVSDLVEQNTPGLNLCSGE